MLTFILRAARRQLCLFLLAVFFSQSGIGAQPNLPLLGESFNDLIYDLARSVVVVETTRRLPFAEGVMGAEESIHRGSTTGLIGDSAGHVIVAASAVIGCEQLSVRVAQNRVAAELVGIDYHTGLALLKTDKLLGHPVRLSSEQTCAGEMVIMLGNSNGLRVSPAIGFCAGRRLDGNMQFSLGLSSSAAGGGVFDLSGHLIAVLLNPSGGEPAATEALPAYRLPKIIRYLIQNGDRPAGYIGISSVEIEITPPLEVPLYDQSAEMAYLLVSRAVVVTEVISGSAADKAGLEQGDLVFAYQGDQIESAAELAAQVIRTHPGELAQLSFLRQNRHFNIQLRIGQKQLAPLSAMTSGAVSATSKAEFSDSLSSEILSLKERVAQLERLLSER